jgi:DNA invertase Pin-like site-specific DNA recombinase
MKIGYARVSTEDQDLRRQIAALEEAGCEQIYTEKISGKTDNRPELNKVLALLQPGDVLVVQKLDRLGRSLSHLLKVVEQLKDRKVHFKSLSDNFDTTTSQGVFIFQVMGAFAELERNMISERTRDGLKVRKAQGMKLGRPERVYPDVHGVTLEEAIVLGMSKAQYYQARKQPPGQEQTKFEKLQAIEKWVKKDL